MNIVHWYHRIFKVYGAQSTIDERNKNETASLMSYVAVLLHRTREVRELLNKADTTIGPTMINN